MLSFLLHTVYNFCYDASEELKIKGRDKKGRDKKVRDKSILYILNGLCRLLVHRNLF